MLVELISAATIFGGLIVGVDKFEKYGKENGLYKNGYLVKE